MRHRNKVNHLGRKQAHRKALLMNLSNSLIKHKRIITTLAKAKELRKNFEPLVTRAKTDSTHNRRMVFSHLQDKHSINELFSVITDKVGSRPGGYTRIIKLGFRKGDAAEMAMIELVDFNEVYVKETKESAGRTRRGRSKKSAKNTNVEENVTPTEDLVEDVETVVEDVKEEATDNNDVVENVEETVEEVSEAKEEEKVEDKKEEVPAKEEQIEENIVESNDLKVIEGIGPAIEKILNAKGLTTYAQMADSSADAIKEILAEAGSRYTMHDPTTWPEQATLLRDGKMDEFKALTDALDGGKRVD